jgi:mono/diheme cytochrome c family protein
MISMRALNAGLLLAFAASVAADLLLRPDPTVPNREALPEMVRTARFNAFSPNPIFPDGKTLQLPVAGTVSRDALPLHYAATPEDAVRAGEELSSPVAPGDAAAVRRGQRLYATFCAACHGGTGRGDGPVVGRGFPAPPSLFADRALRMKDGQVFHVVTYGQGNMPSYAAQISRADRWRVVAWLRAWQRQPDAAVPGGAR